MALTPVIIPALVKQTATIIFLHGLGDSGHGWAEILQTLRPPYAKLNCPSAAQRPVTLNHGMEIPAWFDLRPLDEPRDVEGIQKAAKMVESLIQDEIDKGIPLSRILLGGFSQGGALALYTGLTGKFELPGILALSTWLPIERNVNWNKVHKSRILQCHGEEDSVVSIVRARSSAKILESHLPTYRFQTYPGLDHDINNEREVNDIKAFLREILPPTKEVSSKL